MIDVINILHECHSGDFTCHSGEKAAGLLCIVPYHHKIVVKLGKYGFDSLSEFPVGPCRRTPVLLVQAIWNFKGDGCRFKEILLYRRTEIPLVTEHHAVMVFPSDILEIMNVMDACRSHVVRMYDALYSADRMEFVSIIVHALRSAIAPIRCCFHIVSSHFAASCPCVLAYLYGLGVDAEHILPAVYGNRNLLADFFGKPGSQFSADFELPAADKIWQIDLAFVVQAMEQEIFTVEPERLGYYTESYDFKVGELRNNTASGYIS